MKTVYIKRNDLFKDINLVMCNNIETIDNSFVEDNYSLYSEECAECEGMGEKDDVRCDECCGEGSHTSDVYQSFLCNVSDYTKERLVEYGVKLGHSELLDLDVLPIYDWGTSWDHFSYSKEVGDDYVLAYNETLERSTVY